MKKITLILSLLIGLNMFAFDCNKASTEIMDLYKAKKYNEISDKRLDDKFAWNCKKDYNMLVMLGTMHFHKTKNYLKAGNFFEKAIDVYPEYTRAYLNLAAVKIKYEEFDDAVELCEKQLAKDLSSEDKFWFNAQAGMALFKKGASIDDSTSKRNKVLLKSKTYLDKALKLNPTYPTGNYYLATIYEFVLKDSAKTKKHMKIACENGMNAACGKY